MLKKTSTHKHAAARTAHTTDAHTHTLRLASALSDAARRRANSSWSSSSSSSFALRGADAAFSSARSLSFSLCSDILTAVSIALAGPGPLSLDHATRDVFNRPWMKAVALGAIVPASVFMIVQRNRALAAAVQ